MRKKNLLSIWGLVGAGALISANTAIAGEALSWNLSRDMADNITKNPSGVWAFMQNTTGVHEPSNYTFLKKYSTSLKPSGSSYPMINWIGNGDQPYIGIPSKTYNWRKIATKGVVHLHPADNGTQPIIRWRSPINGTISVLGRVSDVDGDCGDGVNWSLEQGSNVLQSGFIDGNGSVFSVQDLEVTKGTDLYFIVDMSDNHACDTTNLDMIITSQQ
jgi:hypothetical protein